MRILFIGSYYPPYEVGGYEQLCRNVAMHLTERGYQIQILTGEVVNTFAKADGTK